MKLYRIVDDRNEELIEPTEDIDDDVLITHMGIAALIKSDRNRKINDTKDQDLYIDCGFIFESVARTERLFSHCKYIKTATWNNLTPQLIEAINF